MTERPKISLRIPELTDAPTILEWENNPDNQPPELTGEKYQLTDIESLIQSFKESKDQIRYLIIDHEDRSLGAVDIFGMSNDHVYGEVGVLIADKKNRRKGVALHALLLLEQKAVQSFGLQELRAKVETENEASIQLFLKAGYQKIESVRELLPNGEYIQAIIFNKWLKS